MLMLTVLLGQYRKDISIVLYDVRKYIKKSKMRRGKAKMYVLSTGVGEGCLLWVANSPAETIK